MMRRKLFRIGIFLVCVALILTGLVFRYSVMDGVLVMPVREATWFYKALLLVNSNYGPAWNGLGVTHVAVYALDVEYLEIPLFDNRLGWLQPSQVSVPPYTLAKRIAVLPKDRAIHLAQATQAFRVASRLGGESRYTGMLGLGYTLFECRDRFVGEGWPLGGHAFDTEAQQHLGDAIWWGDQALLALRPILTRDLPNTIVSEDPRLSEIRDAEILIRHILEARESLSDVEAKELDALRNTSTEWWWDFSSPVQGALHQQPEDLEALYPVTSEGLATAELYLRAADRRFENWDSFVDLPLVGMAEKIAYRGRPLSLYERMRMVSYMKRNEPVYELVREASTRHVCRYPIDFSEYNSFRASAHLGPLFRVGLRLALKTLYAAEIGDSVEVTATLLDSLALAESLRQEPLWDSQSRRLSLIRLTLIALEDAQNRLALSDAQSELIQRRLQALEGYESYLAGLKIDTFFTQMRLRAACSDDSEDTMDPIDMLTYYGVPGAEAYGALSDEVIAALGKPHVACAILFERLNAENPDFSLAHPQVFLRPARVHAYLRSAQIALAVGRYAQANAGPPDSLEVLVPGYLDQIPRDPFDGQPLRYRRVGKGFVVYSVDHNLVDDGGVREVKSPTFGYMETADQLYCVGVPEAEVAGDSTE